MILTWLIVLGPVAKWMGSIVFIYFRGGKKGGGGM